jgi:hypothetical protein
MTGTCADMQKSRDEILDRLDAFWENYGEDIEQYGANEEQYSRLQHLLDYYDGLEEAWLAWNHVQRMESVVLDLDDRRKQAEAELDAAGRGTDADALDKAERKLAAAEASEERAQQQYDEALREWDAYSSRYTKGDMTTFSRSGNAASRAETERDLRETGQEMDTNYLEDVVTRWDDLWEKLTAINADIAAHCTPTPGAAPQPNPAPIPRSSGGGGGGGGGTDAYNGIFDVSVDDP